jgi:genome maintenance exonuclease 1
MKTLLIEKYPYKDLTRSSSSGSRLYNTPTGALPSVTSILSATKPQEQRDGLANWRKAIGETRANAICTEAANRGTRMHKYLEDYVNDGIIKKAGSNPYAKEAHLMAEEIIDKGMCHVNECWGTEVSLYYPEIYAGTTDLVGEHKGSPAILDFKQSNKPKKDEYVKDYCIQLAAYAEAHNAVYKTNINTGVILMCVKPEQPAPGVFQKQKYQEWVITGNEFKKWKNVWWKRVEEYYVSHKIKHD